MIQIHNISIYYTLSGYQNKGHILVCFFFSLDLMFMEEARVPVHQMTYVLQEPFFQSWSNHPMKLLVY